MIKINKANGVCTVVGAPYSSDRVGGLGFDSTGVLWHVPGAAGNHIGTLDTTTGAQTNVSVVGSFLGQIINAAKFGPGDICFIIYTDFGGSPTWLATVDVLTGLITTIGFTLSGMDAIAWSGGSLAPAAKARFDGAPAFRVAR